MDGSGCGSRSGTSRSVGKSDRKNPEAFVIESKPGQPGLRIIGASPMGVRHGAYYYLQKLGFRSLFPGEHWQIVPELEKVRVDINQAEAPVYQQRTFFGTGGFHARLPLDPDAKIAKMWSDWRDANLFGQAFNLPGHYGEHFIRRHEAELAANPEYRAMLDGERVPMSVQFQLNYGNKGLRELYVKDRLEELATSLERNPYATYSLTVDPADGGGHCESPEAVALGSVSDRVFGLANEVAKRVQEEYPGNYVNLYAYNMHSDVTTFPLEENVIVSVIPYGFNRSRSLLGDDLLLAWKEKASQIGIYDYWGLPDWSRGVPTVDFVTEIPRRLELWSANKVRFLNAETTTGAGTAGIPLYLASKVLWNPETNYQQELEAFYDQAFGPARAPMQRMLERWASGFQLQDNELGLTFRDLQEAHQLAAGRRDVQARIEDFITYVHYLRLLWEFDVAAGDPEARHKTANALLRYLWQIRQNAMVQTFRIHQLMINGWAKTDEELRTTWDYGNPDAAGWATVGAYPEAEEIVKLLTRNTADYPVLFEPGNFSKAPENLTPALSAEERWHTDSLETYILFKGHELVVQAEQDGMLPVEFFFSPQKNATEDAVVTVHEVEGGKKLILQAAYPLDGEWHSLKAPVEKGKNYRLTVQGRASGYRLRFPGTLPLVLTQGTLPVNWVGTKNWFYVPEGTRRFAIFVRGNPVTDQTIVETGSEIPVAPFLEKGGFQVYEVPPGEDGGIWSVDKFRSAYHVQLLNVPNNLAFSKETLLIPKEFKK